MPAEKTTAATTANSIVFVRLGSARMRWESRVTGASSASDAAGLAELSIVKICLGLELGAHQLLVGAHCFVAKRKRHLKCQFRLLCSDHGCVDVCAVAGHHP